MVEVQVRSFVLCCTEFASAGREDGRPAPAIYPCRGGEKPEDNGTDEERLTERLSHMWWSQVPEHVPCSYGGAFQKSLPPRKLTALAHRLPNLDILPLVLSRFRCFQASWCLCSTLPILITSFKLNNLLNMPNNPLNPSLNPPLLKGTFSCKTSDQI